MRALVALVLLTASARGAVPDRIPVERADAKTNRARLRPGMHDLPFARGHSLQLQVAPSTHANMKATLGPGGALRSFSARFSQPVKVHGAAQIGAAYLGERFGLFGVLAGGMGALVDPAVWIDTVDLAVKGQEVHVSASYRGMTLNLPALSSSLFAQPLGRPQLAAMQKLVESAKVDFAADVAGAPFKLGLQGSMATKGTLHVDDKGVHGELSFKLPLPKF